MSKPSYTPGQVKQLVDAADDTLRKNADHRSDYWKPVVSCLNFLDDLAAGKIEIREIKNEHNKRYMGKD